jgi:type II secretory pathway component PulK
MTTERGFALVVVLLVMTIVGIVGAEFAYSMRLEAAAVRAYKDGILASHMAEAAVAQAIREIVADSRYVTFDEHGLLTFYTQDRLALPQLPREKVDFGGGQYSYRITDEEARINLNTSTPDRVDRLLQFCIGLDKSKRDVINDSLQDWRDANDTYRLNGAESDDFYLKLPVPYRAHNANLESVTELLQIHGVLEMPTIYFGTADHPGLVDIVTVKTPSQTINMNTATKCAMQALGLSDAEIIEIEQSRSLAPYTAVPGKFGGRGMGVTTSTFRIEAQGIVNGRVAARLDAIVQKRAQATPPVVAIFEWSVPRESR